MGLPESNRTSAQVHYKVGQKIVTIGLNSQAGRLCGLNLSNVATFSQSGEMLRCALFFQSDRMQQSDAVLSLFGWHSCFLFLFFSY